MLEILKSYYNQHLQTKCCSCVLNAFVITPVLELQTNDTIKPLLLLAEQYVLFLENKRDNSTGTTPFLDN